MNIRITGTYRSIAEMEWCDIPPLAVISGENGVGKSQLLDVLAHSTGSYQLETWVNPRNGSPPVIGATATFENAEFTPGDVLHARSEWRPISLGACTVEIVQQALVQLQSERTPQQRPAWWAPLSDETGMDIKELLALHPAEFRRFITPGILWSANYSPANSNLAFLFQAYRLFVHDAQEDGLDLEAITQRYGEAPWTFINEILSTAGLPYRIDEPASLSRRRTVAEPPLTIVLRNENGVEIPFDALSSGERVIMTTVLWRYGALVAGRYYKLLLLDEPDAHLHPSLTRSLLDVLERVFVNERGVRAIITTHSPSTIALSPEGSVFVMSRSKPRISRAKSKADTVGLLTAGLVTVTESTKYVLVEDETDVRFYSAVRDLLMDYGPSRDQRAIQPTPSIVFLPASVAKGAAKIAGGNTVVTGWIAKLKDPPLDELFRGVIDHDENNAGTARVYVIRRHSIENYFADPLVVYGLLSDRGLAPAVNGVNLSRGDEHLLREMPEAQLQAIVTALAEIVASTAAAAIMDVHLTQKPVTFTNGKTVQYPAWMLEYRGHDLLRAYQQAFATPQIISPPNLLAVFRRVRLIPVELADLMARLQS